MVDPATKTLFKGLILSANDLHQLTDWPSALVEDYLNILNNLITLSDTLDDNTDRKIEEIATDLTDEALIIVDSGFLASLGVQTDGQLIIGSTGNPPSKATLTGTASQITITNAAGSITISIPNPAAITFANNGLHILDTNASHDLIITPGSNLTADRILTLITGDVARTITLNGDPTLADWFDQAIKTSSSPTFAALTRVGDVTNYTKIETDGTIEFNGDATVWDDLRVSLSSARIPAANAPNWAKVTDDGAASTGVFAWHFDDGEYIEFHVQMPHGWKVGSTIYPHIHFECTSDVDPTDKFDIELEYFWVDINEDRPANTTLINQECETGVDTDTMHQIVNIPSAGISGVGHTLSSILICRLERIAAASDNYADQIIIYDFDIHYEIDTVGSRQITSK